MSPLCPNSTGQRRDPHLLLQVFGMLASLLPFYAHLSFPVRVTQTFSPRNPDWPTRQLRGKLGRIGLLTAFMQQPRRPTPFCYCLVVLAPQMMEL